MRVSTQSLIAISLASMTLVQALPTSNNQLRVALQSRDLERRDGFSDYEECVKQVNKKYKKIDPATHKHYISDQAGFDAAIKSCRAILDAARADGTAYAEPKTSESKTKKEEKKERRRKERTGKN
ncbi:hypothetical protein C8J56DRAFT_1094332 [Mycena floridula]|nr:hypothetical protein C8J56DRAFT_1094332 [Mycena floridula]